MIWGTFMYFLLPIYGLIILILFFLKKKIMRVMKNLLVCAMGINFCVMKNLPNFLEGNNGRCETLFSFRDKIPFCENSLLYKLSLNRNYPIIQIFHIVRLTVLGIYLSVVAPILLFVQIFGACVVSFGI